MLLQTLTSQVGPDWTTELCPSFKFEHDVRLTADIVVKSRFGIGHRSPKSSWHGQGITPRVPLSTHGGVTKNKGVSHM